MLVRWNAQGYVVHVLFVWRPSADETIREVRRRRELLGNPVAEGRDDKPVVVPPEDLELD